MLSQYLLEKSYSKRSKSIRNVLQFQNVVILLFGKVSSAPIFAEI